MRELPKIITVENSSPTNSQILQQSKLAVIDLGKTFTACDDIHRTAPCTVT